MNERINRLLALLDRVEVRGRSNLDYLLAAMQELEHMRKELNDHDQSHA